MSAEQIFSINQRASGIEWLNTDEAAAYLRISVGALRNMTSDGKIPFYKLGRRNRYRLSELRDLMMGEKRGARNGY